MNCGLDPTVRSDKPRTLQLDGSTAYSVSSRYPRTLPQATRNGTRYHSTAARNVSESSYGSLTTLYSEDRLDIPEGRKSIANPEALEGHIDASQSSYAPLTSSETITPEPINPPDVDYAVREMDLYYHQPRQLSFGEEIQRDFRHRFAAGIDSLTTWWKRDQNSTKTTP